MSPGSGARSAGSAPRSFLIADELFQQARRSLPGNIAAQSVEQARQMTRELVGAIDQRYQRQPDCEAANERDAECCYNCRNVAQQCPPIRRTDANQQRDQSKGDGNAAGQDLELRDKRSIKRAEDRTDSLRCSARRH
jgi:hypothetical protein